MYKNSTNPDEVTVFMDVQEFIPTPKALFEMG